MHQGLSESWMACRARWAAIPPALFGAIKRKKSGSTAVHNTIFSCLCFCSCPIFPLLITLATLFLEVFLTIFSVLPSPSLIPVGIVFTHLSMIVKSNIPSHLVLVCVDLSPGSSVYYTGILNKLFLFPGILSASICKIPWGWW
jgi:hypothetical protein